MIPDHLIRLIAENLRTNRGKFKSDPRFREVVNINLLRLTSDNKSILKQAEKANQAAELLLEREQDTRSQLEAQISKIKKQLEVFRDETSFELVSIKDKSREEQKTFSEMKFQLEQNMKDMENTIKSFESKLEGKIFRRPKTDLNSKTIIKSSY